MRVSNLSLRRSFLLLLIAAPVQVAAEQALAKQDDDLAIGVDQRNTVVSSLGELLESQYVFPDIGEECSIFIRTRLESGAYDDLIDAYAFAEALTADLRHVSHDGHMNVNLNPAGAVNSVDPEEIEREDARALRASRRDNFAFRKLEWLQGNVMFLELRSFRHTKDAGPTAVAAMNFMAHADAVIIDLRSNRGGDPTMIQLLSSYFFEEPTHLNSFEIRGQEQPDQRWTLPHVPGPKLVDTPLFVLIGNYTYSAAEEFAYNLKALDRATLIGQRTGGGAHPTHNYRIDDIFAASIPFARAVNPVTGRNWEGTGVEPDISLDADDFHAGRARAHLEALMVIEQTLEEGWYRDALRTLIDELRSQSGS